MLLQSLYQYGENHHVALPAGCTRKTPKGFILLTNDGQFIGIEPNNQPIICPSIFTEVYSGNKSDVFVEKRGILLGEDGPQGNEEKFRNKRDSIALKTVTNRDSIRGIEGTAASIYFQQFDKMLHSDKIGFSFGTRSRRPPQNEVNATLSFAYAMLTNEYTSAIESIGLDPAVGVLHSVRPGRPSLALDLMEELRAPLCDRLTIAMFNRRELQSSHFDERSDGVSLNEKGRKLFLQKWQLRKNEEIIHPYLQEKMKIGLIPFIQAQLFAKTIRGELPEYPPFIWR